MIERKFVLYKTNLMELEYSGKENYVLHLKSPLLYRLS